MARTAQTRLIASRSSRMYALPTLIHGVITVYIWEVLSRSSARHHHGDLHGARSAPAAGRPHYSVVSVIPTSCSTAADSTI
jgi:hypothetical protein